MNIKNLYRFEQLAASATLWLLHHLAKQKVSFVFCSAEDLQKMPLEN